MVNDHLQRRVADLEKELRDVGERICTDDSFTDWRRVGRGRRRDLDSDD